MRIILFISILCDLAEVEKHFLNDLLKYLDHAVVIVSDLREVKVF